MQFLGSSAQQTTGTAVIQTVNDDVSAINVSRSYLEHQQSSQVQLFDIINYLINQQNKNHADVQTQVIKFQKQIESKFESGLFQQSKKFQELEKQIAENSEKQKAESENVAKVIEEQKLELQNQLDKLTNDVIKKLNSQVIGLQQQLSTVEGRCDGNQQQLKLVADEAKQIADDLKQQEVKMAEQLKVTHETMRADLDTMKQEQRDQSASVNDLNEKMNTEVAQLEQQLNETILLLQNQLSQAITHSQEQMQNQQNLAIQQAQLLQQNIDKLSQEQQLSIDEIDKNMQQTTIQLEQQIEDLKNQLIASNDVINQQYLQLSEQLQSDLKSFEHKTSDKIQSIETVVESNQNKFSNQLQAEKQLLLTDLDDTHLKTLVQLQDLKTDILTRLQQQQSLSETKIVELDNKLTCDMCTSSQNLNGEFVRQLQKLASFNLSQIDDLNAKFANQLQQASQDLKENQDYCNQSTISKINDLRTQIQINQSQNTSQILQLGSEQSQWSEKQGIENQKILLYIQNLQSEDQRQSADFLSKITTLGSNFQDQLKDFAKQSATSFSSVDKKFQEQGDMNNRLQSQQDANHREISEKLSEARDDLETQLKNHEVQNATQFADLTQNFTDKLNTTHQHLQSQHDEFGKQTATKFQILQDNFENQLMKHETQNVAQFDSFNQKLATQINQAKKLIEEKYGEVMDSLEEFNSDVVDSFDGIEKQNQIAAQKISDIIQNFQRLETMSKVVEAQQKTNDELIKKTETKLRDHQLEIETQSQKIELADIMQSSQIQKVQSALSDFSEILAKVKVFEEVQTIQDRKVFELHNRTAQMTAQLSEVRKIIDEKLGKVNREMSDMIVRNLSMTNFLQKGQPLLGNETQSTLVSFNKPPVAPKDPDYALLRENYSSQINVQEIESCDSSGEQQKTLLDTELISQVQQIDTRLKLVQERVSALEVETYGDSKRNSVQIEKLCSLLPQVSLLK